MVPQYCNTSIKNVLISSKIFKENDSIKFLALLSSATLKMLNDTIKLKVSSLIISSTTIVILQDNMHWLLPGNNKLPSIVSEQAMSNLIEVVSVLIWFLCYILFYFIQIYGHGPITYIYNKNIKISVHLQDFCDSSLVLNFLDDVASTDATWTLDFVSPSAAEAVVSSIRPPWEELFSVPLQVNSALMAESSEIQEMTWHHLDYFLLTRKNCELVCAVVISNIISIRRFVITCVLYLYLLYGLTGNKFKYFTWLMKTVSKSYFINWRFLDFLVQFGLKFQSMNCSFFVLLGNFYFKTYWIFTYT